PSSIRVLRQSARLWGFSDGVFWHFVGGCFHGLIAQGKEEKNRRAVCPRQKRHFRCMKAALSFCGSGRMVNGEVYYDRLGAPEL
ncbi:hypothetical protein, partial [Prevotella dentasini]